MQIKTHWKQWKDFSLSLMSSSLQFKSKITATLLVMLVVGNFLSAPLLTIPIAQAQTLNLAFKDFKSVDVMKYTKDTMANQPSDATIQNLVGTLVNGLHV